jgi:hypothetical protein
MRKVGSVVVWACANPDAGAGNLFAKASYAWYNRFDSCDSAKSTRHVGTF